MLVLASNQQIRVGVMGVASNQSSFQFSLFAYECCSVVRDLHTVMNVITILHFQKCKEITE